ncbi:hypothetical protein QSU92_01920 [Microbacterium sp. ET2]|uniref:hypothetical protein n=1 Tax=Microbacterium albipurpureum TaxID=3050384 RepID=UPI00259CFFCB|nr:hypothetical protein [Microbacterium sp. ET2 (Ac-2212)]WJL95995.1 hypothetical protein QSU92_01920 [Microbacterium sp. ET2 (Ac-2212)]
MQHALVTLVAAATPSPVPTVDPDLVTPGPVGFAVIAFIALAVVFLVWDMMRRIRRARIRGEINEQLDAEEQMRDGDGRS